MDYFIDDDEEVEVKEEAALSVIGIISGLYSIVRLYVAPNLHIIKENNLINKTLKWATQVEETKSRSSSW